MPSDRQFLPAAGRLPLALYDRGVRLTMRERVWRPRLARAVADVVGVNGSAAEVGAGTGALTHELRDALSPSVKVTAIDPDERALAIARRKVGDAGVCWLLGRAEALPLADASQDAVITTLMLHHLTPAAKRSALTEAARVLRPGGALFIADFGRPQDPLMAVAFELIRLIDGRETTAGHREGVILETLAETGFRPPLLLQRLRTPGGTLEVLRATRP